MSFERDLVKFTKELRARLGDAYSKKFMSELGSMMIQIIVKRTRRGFGVRKAGAKLNRLAPLRPATIAYRSANRNKLSSETSPRKSNLTFSGQLLNSIRVTKVRQSNRASFVSIGANKRRRKSGITNENLLVEMEKGSSNRKAREFLNLSSKELEQLEKFMDRRLSTVLKNNL